MCPVSGTLVAGGFIDSLTFLLDHMNRLTSGLIFPVPHSADVFENLKYMDLVRGGEKETHHCPRGIHSNKILSRHSNTLQHLILKILQIQFMIGFAGG